MGGVFVRFYKLIHDRAEMTTVRHKKLIFSEPVNFNSVGCDKTVSVRRKRLATFGHRLPSRQLAFPTVWGIHGQLWRGMMNSLNEVVVRDLR